MRLEVPATAAHWIWMVVATEAVYHPRNLLRRVAQWLGCIAGLDEHLASPQKTPRLPQAELPEHYPLHAKVGVDQPLRHGGGACFSAERRGGGTPHGAGVVAGDGGVMNGKNSRQQVLLFLL